MKKKGKSKISKKNCNKKFNIFQFNLNDLREELRIAEEDMEDRCASQIISAFIRTMITRANSKLRDLVRLRQQRQN